MVLVSTKVPAMKATPSTMAMQVDTSRRLCDQRERNVVRSMGASGVSERGGKPGRGRRSRNGCSRTGSGGRRCLSVAEGLHEVDDGICGRLEHFVNELAVGQHQNPVCIRRGHRIMGDHHDGLAVVSHGPAHEPEDL